MSVFRSAPVGPTFSRVLFSLIFGTVLLAVSLPITARIFPEEGRTLNYRIIGVSFPENMQASQYIVEISAGHYDGTDDFTRQIFQKINTDSSRVIVNVPFWGSEYSWRVIYKSGNVTLDSSSIYHFATAALSDDTVIAKRLRVISCTQQMSDIYILVDGINIMYDLNGEPVWCSPQTELFRTSCDLKASTAGTFTFIAGADAYEADYDGRILWKTKPKADAVSGTATSGFHHHEFTRRGNGHYMALIAAPVSPEALLENADTGKNRFFPALSVSSLKEFDRNGNEVWLWDASKYAKQGDLQTFRERYSDRVIDLHENAFYFDEGNSVVYLSLAGINRILKIQYPSGQVLAEYGSKVPSGTRTMPGSSPMGLRKLFENKMFHNPHAVKLSADGLLYLCSADIQRDSRTGEISRSYPKVLMMKESGGTLKKTWELDCRQYISGIQNVCGGGGNVVELPGNALFVSMCMPYSNMFIVDKDKHLLWNAVTEVRQPGGQGWTQYPRYRASVVTRQQLEHMIWRGQ